MIIDNMLVIYGILFHSNLINKDRIVEEYLIIIISIV